MTQERRADDEAHEGGCLCGAVRYRIDGPIDSVVHCHCSMCRRASGAPVVTWLTVAADRFALTKGEPVRFKSSDHGERGFCPTCGAQITFVTRHRPQEVDVTVGSLDHPEAHPAERHIWTSSRLPWLRLDEELPAYAGFSPGDGGE
ncbi:MAG: GFA family protein [Kiloniellaceae bacterium]